MTEETILVDECSPKITPKLHYEKVKARFPRNCEYCGKEFLDLYVVNSPNQDIFKFFNRPKFRAGQNFYLCPECWDKLHGLLEDIESDGWTVLDPDSEEFKGLDEEVQNEDEDGSGR